MATERQIKANQQNALKSSGPKSSVGKMIASRNATRHGFYSTSVLLPDEDREEFLRLARRLVSAYSPCGVLEEELVRSIIETHWQLRRANLVDSELFQIYGFYKEQNRGVGTAFAQDATQGNAFSKLTRYQNFLLRKLHQAQAELVRLQAQSARAVPLAQPASGLQAGTYLSNGQFESEAPLVATLALGPGALVQVEPRLLGEHANLEPAKPTV